MRMKTMSTNPTVELLIPVYKPGEELAALLKYMKKQTYPLQAIHLLVTAGEKQYEKICETYRVTDGCLRDENHNGCVLEDVVLRFTRIDPSAFDHGGTRHLGASQSTADILLFMTQDAVPENEHLVEEIVKAFAWGNAMAADGDGLSGQQPVIAAAYARQLPVADCNFIEQYTRQFNYPAESRVKTKEDLPVLGIKTYFCSNVCAAYRRDVYEQLGGFERRTIFNEDMIFAAGLIQAGYGVAYAAEARVIHSHNYSDLQQLHRNFDLAVSQAEHPEIFEAVPSEGEGIRMVKSTAAYLCKCGKAYFVPKLVWQSVCKYLGYLLGKKYRRLPKKLVLWLTMNKRYWRE